MNIIVESTGAPVSGLHSIFGRGSGDIMLDNVVCNGQEQDLLLCSHDGIMSSNCDHSEDAAVICGSKLITLPWLCSNDILPPYS